MSRLSVLEAGGLEPRWQQGHVLSTSSKEILPCPFQHVQAPGIPGWQVHHPGLRLHLHMAFSLCGPPSPSRCMCPSLGPNCPSYKNTSPIASGPSLTWLPLQRPCFQLKSHPQVPGVRMSISLLGTQFSCNRNLLLGDRRKWVTKVQGCWLH